jgi:hypothetical protein
LVRFLYNINTLLEDPFDEKSLYSHDAALNARLF